MKMSSPFFISFALVLALGANTEQARTMTSSPRHPVILVPGDGGSRLLAKLDKHSGVHYWCYQHTTDYFLLWLNIDSLFSKFMDCFIDNIQLHWNWVDRKTYNTPGVDIQVSDWGKTSAVENLSDWTYWFGRYTVYLNTVVNLMVSKLNYTRSVDLFAAPYDFRKAPNELDQFFLNLTRLTETAYYQNNNTRVIVVAHSYGCMLTLSWLHSQPQAWKDKFVEHFVSLAGPYGGTALAYEVYTAGYNLGMWELSALRLRQEQRTSPSLAFLMPNPAVWPKNFTFVNVTDTNTSYGVQDDEHFFTDIKYIDAWEMRKDTRSLLDITKPPGVSMFCGYSTTKDGTTEWLNYDHVKDFPSSPSTIFRGDGDGTVNLRSLRWCETWRGKQKQPVVSKLFTGVNHMAMVTDSKMAEYIVDHLSDVNQVRGANRL